MKELKHPLEIIQENQDQKRTIIQWNDKILELIANNILGSIICFDLAIIIPLLAIPASTDVKALVFLISGNWIQLWALFALQHTQKKADELRNIKADTDHKALTQILNRINKGLD